MNTDPYGGECFRFAEAWADLMEAALQRGETIEMMAKETSHEADTDGITGFMYGKAVSILSFAWKHGEALRIWHNTEYGQPETKGVVNPAVLTIKAPDGMSDEQVKGYIADAVEKSGIGRMMSNLEFEEMMKKKKKKA